MLNLRRVIQILHDPQIIKREQSRTLKVHHQALGTINIASMTNQFNSSFVFVVRLNYFVILDGVKHEAQDQHLIRR